MTNAIAYGILLAFGTLALALVAARPEWVSDQNSFLVNFVNHEFINVLGITLAITLASSAQIHLAFNRLEEQYRARNVLEGARAELRSATYWLISLFVVGVVVVVIKPIAASSLTSQGVFNMAAMFVLLWHVLILISLTQLVFAIEPEYMDQASRDNDDPSRPAE